MAGKSTASLADHSSNTEGGLHEWPIDRRESAWATVYERHAPAVFRAAFRVTANRPAAEEVTQALFLDVWHRPTTFDPTKGSLRPWLATIAHRRGVDWVRQETARRTRERQDFEAPTSNSPNVEETVMASMTAERIQLALHDLCDTESAPIRLAYFGHRTYRQVAEDLGLAEGTVKSRIRTGLHHLAQALRDPPVDPTENASAP